MFFSPVDVKIVALRNGLYVFFFGEERLYFQLQEMLGIDIRCAACCSPFARDDGCENWVDFENLIAF